MHSSDNKLTQARWDTLTGRKSESPPTQSPITSDLPPEPAPFAQTTPEVSSFIVDAAQLHPLANLNQDTLDYLTIEDSVLSDLPGSRSALPSRGWSDDLCYGTGVTYLTALTVGGAWGMAEGWNRAPQNATPRLRLNYVLNAMTRRGPFLGNSAGVIAMVYNGINSTIGYYRGKRML
jgi:mitochondrial import inner membrane translocase subunit TIM23